MEDPSSGLAQRFRGFLPVVVDVETGGFNPETDALLEIAAVYVCMDAEGDLAPCESQVFHIIPFPGAHLNEASMRFTGIDPDHPFRFAVSEHEALTQWFSAVRRAVKVQGCRRAILVGHNPCFDLAFIKAAARRAGIEHIPFHAFSTFDTVTLAGLAYGQTVLARAVQAAGLPWDSSEAHSAHYDADRTAELFCTVGNDWRRLAQKRRR